MKKNFSVNISGMLFQIDEDAYEKLNRYLDRLQLHFADTEGKDEIIADIEQRISEMLVDRLGDQNRIVTLGLIEEVIRVLGEPADIDDTIPEPEPSGRKYRKRLFRDPEEKILGGVAGGMGAYFNVDPLWFRIAFILLTFFGGSGIIVYLILWLIVPEARTTAERLEMRGEEININNIERTIKEEMNDLRSRFGKWKQSGYSKKKDSTGRFFESLAQMFVTLFVLFFKFIAGVIGFAIAIAVIAFIITIFVPGLSFHGFPLLYDVSVHDFLTALTGSSGVAWLLLISFALVILLPLLGMFWAGIRLMTGIKKRNRIVGVSATGVWTVAVVFTAVIAIITINDFSTKGFVSSSQSVMPATDDTLVIGLQPGPADRWIDDDDRKHFKSFIFGVEEDKLILAGTPSIEFRQGISDSVVVTITKRSRGSNYKTAKQQAADIRFNSALDSTSVMLDKYFLTPSGANFRKQEVKVNIYIPQNRIFRLDPSLQQAHRHISNFDPLWDEQILDKPLTISKNQIVSAE